MMARPGPDGGETGEDAPGHARVAHDAVQGVGPRQGGGVEGGCQGYVRANPAICIRARRERRQDVHAGRCSLGAPRRTWPAGLPTRTTTVHVDDAARLYLLVAEKGQGW